MSATGVALAVMSVLYTMLFITFSVWLILTKKRLLNHVKELGESALKISTLQKAHDLDTGAIDDMQQEIGRLKAENARLRIAIADAQKRLVQCQDPRAIKAWLDDVLSGDI